MSLGMKLNARRSSCVRCALLQNFALAFYLDFSFTQFFELLVSCAYFWNSFPFAFSFAVSFSVCPASLVLVLVSCIQDVSTTKKE